MAVVPPPSFIDELKKLKLYIKYEPRTIYDKVSYAKLNKDYIDEDGTKFASKKAIIDFVDALPIDKPKIDIPPEQIFKYDHLPPEISTNPPPPPQPKAAKAVASALINPINYNKDIVVIGAGPVGLWFVISLLESKSITKIKNLTVLEKYSEKGMQKHYTTRKQQFFIENEFFNDLPKEIQDNLLADPDACRIFRPNRLIKSYCYKPATGFPDEKTPKTSPDSGKNDYINGYSIMINKLQEVFKTYIDNQLKKQQIKDKFNNKQIEFIFDATVDKIEDKKIVYKINGKLPAKNQSFETLVISSGKIDNLGIDTGKYDIKSKDSATNAGDKMKLKDLYGAAINITTNVKLDIDSVKDQNVIEYFNNSDYQHRFRFFRQQSENLYLGINLSKDEYEKYKDLKEGTNEVFTKSQDLFKNKDNINKTSPREIKKIYDWIATIISAYTKQDFTSAGTDFAIGKGEFSIFPIKLMSANNPFVRKANNNNVYVIGDAVNSPHFFSMYGVNSGFKTANMVRDIIARDDTDVAQKEYKTFIDAEIQKLVNKAIDVTIDFKQCTSPGIMPDRNTMIKEMTNDTYKDSNIYFDKLNDVDICLMYDSVRKTAATGTTAAAATAATAAAATAATAAAATAATAATAAQTAAQAAAAAQAEADAKATATNGTNTIKVLTYNVSWEAMTANSKSKSKTKKFTGSAKKVAELCHSKTKDDKDDKNNVCLQNVANVIENTPELDFVGLQEASNWELIIEKSEQLKQMKYIHSNVVGYEIDEKNMAKHTNPTEDLVSFYNPKIFDFVAVKISIIKDRPFHIVYLKHKVTQEQYAFINVHLPHLNDKTKNKINDIYGLSNINYIISGYASLDNLENLKSFIFPREPQVNDTEEDKKTKKYTNKDDTKYKKDIEDYENMKKKYNDDIKAYNKKLIELNTKLTFNENFFNDIYNTNHIIFLGDTNDENKLKLYDSFSPFNNIHTDKIKDPRAKIKADKFKQLSVSSKTMVPPGTCCNSDADINAKYTSNFGKYNRVADYILISNELDYVKDKANIIPKFLSEKTDFNSYPTSDHLPVYAEIEVPGSIPKVKAEVKPKTTDSSEETTKGTKNTDTFLFNNIVDTNLNIINNTITTKDSFKILKIFYENKDDNQNIEKFANKIPNLNKTFFISNKFKNISTSDKKIIVGNKSIRQLSEKMYSDITLNFLSINNYIKNIKNTSNTDGIFDTFWKFIISFLPKSLTKSKIKINDEYYLISYEEIFNLTEELNNFKEQLKCEKEYKEQINDHKILLKTESEIRVLIAYLEGKKNQYSNNNKKDFSDYKIKYGDNIDNLKNKQKTYHTKVLQNVNQFNTFSIEKQKNFYNENIRNREEFFVRMLGIIGLILYNLITLVNSKNIEFTDDETNLIKYKYEKKPEHEHEPEHEPVKSSGLDTIENIDKTAKDIVDTYTSLDKKDNMNETKNIDIKGIENWIIWNTLGYGDCLIYAILQDISPNYRKLNDSDKQKLTIDYRKFLGEHKDIRFKERLTKIGTWLENKDIDDIAKVLNIIIVVFDPNNSTLNNPNGITAFFGNFKLNADPKPQDDTKVIFIHASGTHYSSISDHKNNFIKEYKDVKTIQVFKRSLTDTGAKKEDSKIQIIKESELTEKHFLTASGGGVIYKVKYSDNFFVYKDMSKIQGNKNTEAEIIDNPDNKYIKILNVIQDDNIYKSMKEYSNLVSPLILVSNDSNNLKGYLMRYLDNEYKTLGNLFSEIKTEEILKKILRQLLSAFKNLQASGTRGCPENENNILIKNLNKDDQELVIIDLDDSVINCKDNTEKELIDSLPNIFASGGENIKTNNKWLFKDNDNIVDSIKTFNDLDKLLYEETSEKKADATKKADKKKANDKPEDPKTSKDVSIFTNYNEINIAFEDGDFEKIKFNDDKDLKISYLKIFFIWFVDSYFKNTFVKRDIEKLINKIDKIVKKWQYLFIAQIINDTILKYIENTNTNDINLKLDITDELFTNLSNEQITELNKLIDETKTFDININDCARMIMQFLVENKENELIKYYDNLNKIEALIKNATSPTSPAPESIYFRDYKFTVLDYSEFTNTKPFTKPGGHSRIEKWEYNGNDYLLKYASLPSNSNIYDNFDFVLSLNEVMAGLVYNRIFKLYAPELFLVCNATATLKQFMIASKYDKNITYAYTPPNLHEDIEKGFYADCIMANWDAFIGINQLGANMFSTQKNTGNQSRLSNRILRLDVGGAMSIRAQGIDKLSFINNSEPNEHDIFITKHSEILKSLKIDKSLEYIKQLYENGAFQQLDILRKEIINTLETSKKLTEPRLTKLMYRLVNSNIVQIKRRWLWYLNQNTKISIDQYIYPLNTNIIADEKPKQWAPISPADDVPNDSKILKKTNESLRIMTYNIGPLNQSSEPKNIFNPYDADILCYQETKHDQYVFKQNKLNCDPHRTDIGYGVNTINYDDTNINKKYNIILQEGFALEETDGTKLAGNGKCVNVIGLEFKENNMKLLIYNVHLDVANEYKGREWRIKSLELINQKYNDKKKIYPNAIIVGDFNTYNYTNYTNEQRHQLITSKGVNGNIYATQTFFEMGMTIDECNKEFTNSLDYSDETGYISKFANHDKNNKVPINVLKDAGWVEAIEINGLPSPVNTSRYSGKVDFIFLSPDWDLKINGIYYGNNNFNSDHLPLFMDIEMMGNLAKTPAVTLAAKSGDSNLHKTKKKGVAFKNTIAETKEYNLNNSEHRGTQKIGKIHSGGYKKITKNKIQKKSKLTKTKNKKI